MNMKNFQSTIVLTYASSILRQVPRQDVLFTVHVFHRDATILYWYSSYIGCCQYFSWTVLEDTSFKNNSGCRRANEKGRL